MKITYLSRSAIPSRTANSIHVMKMCNAFAAGGHEVTLAAAGQPVEAWAIPEVFEQYGVGPTFSIDWISGPRWIGAKPGFAWAAGLAARRRRPDLCYGRAVRSCDIAALLGLPTIYEAHRLPESVAAIARFSNLIRRRSFRRLVVITDALKCDFLKRFDLAADSVVVAHDGADEAGACKAAIPSEGNRLQVGYVGQLYPGKGMETIAKLAPICSWVEFHVIGGEDADLERWKSQVGHLDNLVFHGFVPHEQTEAYRQSMDVLIAPYGERVLNCNGNADGARNLSPLKLFEYMASAKAIVCTDLDSIREILAHEETALLCRPGDVEGFARWLRVLWQDAALREQLGTRALREFRLRYTWSARAARVIDGLP